MRDAVLFLSALRDLTRPRRLLVAALLTALPAAVALLLRIVVDPGNFRPLAVYNVLVPGLVFGFILVILAVLFGTGVVSQEIEQKTIVYLLTRPIPRWRLLLPRYLAAVGAICVTGWAATVLVALVLLEPSALLKAPVRRDLLILPVGAAAYGSLFLLLATLIHRPLIWALLYAFGVESWAPYLPGIQKISVMAYLRVLAPHASLEPESVDVREMVTVLTPAAISERTAWIVLLCVAGLGLAAALWLFSTREYVPREDTD